MKINQLLVLLLAVVACHINAGDNPVAAARKKAAQKGRQGARAYAARRVRVADAGEDIYSLKKAQEEAELHDNADMNNILQMYLVARANADRMRRADNPVYVAAVDAAVARLRGLRK